MDSPTLDRGSSPTRSAQEVLRRMSLNSPPSRADNPRQFKRAKLLAGLGEALSSSEAFAVPASQTPRKLTLSRAPLDAQSPMPSWGSHGMNLRDASAGEVLEASDPSSFYPSFQLDCLRQPYKNSSASASPTTRSPNAGSSSSSSSTSTITAGDEDPYAPPPSPARLKMVGSGGVSPGGARASSRASRISAAALEEARRAGGGGVFEAGAAVPDTPVRRPGSSARSSRSGSGSGRGDGSCSPVGGYGGSGSTAQGSPVKKRNVGRWRLSGGGSEPGGGFAESPLRSNRNPFSPDLGGVRSRRASTGSTRGRQDDAMAMPAPAPRSRLSIGTPADASDMSPMDTGDAIDFGALAAGLDSGTGDDGSFLRRISAGSCVSLSDTGGGVKKAPDDATKPSPCDITAFVPITPYRDGFRGMMEADSGERCNALMSPVPDGGGGFFVRSENGIGGGELVERAGSGARRGEKRGRFATDFEELAVIGSGSFGTVYKVKSRLDGCMYAVKCTRRRFKGEADRQNMLREVYALAAVCSAQDTINIVRYHQAWIEDERLYIQTELCETSLEKQLESGHRLEISGVYAFLRQTLLGLDILHQHHLVHLDIKPGNIFVKNGQYKLGDFGLVTPVHVTSGADVVEGDSRYMSKELLNDDHSNLTKCDVFSLGITLYEIISGRPLPPNGPEWHSLRSGRVGMPMGIPAELSKTLHQMMHSDPAQRPSAAELLRYPCLQSEMERQLNDQRSKLNKERTHNLALKLEVSALIQKESQRSGRLSRTVTWDNSYFSKSDPGPLFSQYEGSYTTSNPAKTTPLGGTPPLAARGGSGAARCNAALAKKSTAVFGGGAIMPRFGSGISGVSRGGSAAGAGPGLASLPEKEEAGGCSAMEAAGGGGPASFERLSPRGR